MNLAIVIVIVIVIACLDHMNPALIETVISVLDQIEVQYINHQLILCINVKLVPSLVPSLVLRPSEVDIVRMVAHVKTINK